MGILGFLHGGPLPHTKGLLGQKERLLGQLSHQNPLKKCPAPVRVRFILGSYPGEKIRIIILKMGVVAKSRVVVEPREC